MSGIKYYQLTKGEELPDEFCAVRDIDGEPSEYTFYVPESENAELRELCEDMHEWMGRAMYDGSARKYEYELIVSRMHDLGIEVDG